MIIRWLSWQGQKQLSDKWNIRYRREGRVVVKYVKWQGERTLWQNVPVDNVVQQNMKEGWRTDKIKPQEMVECKEMTCNLQS